MRPETDSLPPSEILDRARLLIAAHRELLDDSALEHAEEAIASQSASEHLSVEMVAFNVIGYYMEMPPTRCSVALVAACVDVLADLEIEVVPWEPN